LRRLVYLDAFVPEDRQSALDLLPTDIQGMIREMARTLGDGWRIPANEELLDIWGLTPGAARDFVRERFSDFSLRCFEQKISMARDPTNLPRTYVAAASDYPGRGAFKGSADAARQQNWEYHELQTGHQCQAEAPEAVASILLAHAPETKS
jgi:pimeloyl-ACP methyl ester carboxylesterase